MSELTAAHSTIEKAREVTNCPADVDLQNHLKQLVEIRNAAEKLVRCKGRYHSELNYRALAALFGVTTPDLPPLDSETPTTDSILREAEARGVEKLAEQYESEIETYRTHDEFMTAHYLKMKANEAREFAQQLREGKAE